MPSLIYNKMPASAQFNFEVPRVSIIFIFQYLSVELVWPPGWFHILLIISKILLYGSTVWLKASYNLKLSCSLTLLRLHSLVIPRSSLVANEDYTIIGNRSGGLIRVVLPFIWFSRLGKTLKERGVFLFSWFTSFHFSYKVVQRAVRVSSLVIFWRRSSSEANSKQRYRRSR